MESGVDVAPEVAKLRRAKPDIVIFQGYIAAPMPEFVRLREERKISTGWFARTRIPVFCIYFDGEFPAILKVANFRDSQTAEKMIHHWDESFDIPAGRFEGRLRRFS